MLLELVYIQGRQKLLEGSGISWKVIETYRKLQKEIEGHRTLWKSLENTRMFHR